MKDDHDFNIIFVSLIEKQPCIYDFNIPDYSKRNVQDKAWETIADAISESVHDCKERWKNLRGCYTRYLKSIGSSGTGTKTKRPYYLAEYLNFLHPFTKTRITPGVSISTVPAPPDLQQIPEEEDVCNNSDNEPENTHPKGYSKGSLSHTPSENDGFVRPASRKHKKNYKLAVSIADVNKSALEYFKSKKGSDVEKKYKDPDLAFLTSVLPDMKEMNNDQKRRFKIGILNLSAQILTEYKPPNSPALSPSSSSPTAIHTCNCSQSLN